MPVIRDFKTINELFYILTEEFASKRTKPIIKHKINGKYVDITHAEFKLAVQTFALGLANLGVKKGDKIAILSENKAEWYVSDMAILSLGAVDVPMYPILTSENLHFILQDSESKGIIVSNKFHLNKVLNIRDKCKSLKFIIVMNNNEDLLNLENIYTFQEIQTNGGRIKEEDPSFFYKKADMVNEDDLCSIIYTSGTTGEPKGVMLTHKNICSNVLGAHQAMHINSEDLFLSFLPLCHIFERTAGYYTAIAGGGTIAIAEGIEKVGQNLLEVCPTIMTAVPRFFERLHSKIMKNIESQSVSKQKIFNWAISTGYNYTSLKRDDEKISAFLKIKNVVAEKLVFKKLKEKTGGRLRFFISGGAALQRELGEFFEAAGILVLEGYGLTESAPVISVNRENNYKHGTVGKPLAGVDIKIAKDGEILVSGANVMQGYYKNKKETEIVLKDGWLHTGDIGVFDADGFLIITDRKKNLFKTSGGKYVAPTPIENMFLASKYIDQFILIGDRRMFLSALVVPDFEALKEYADSHRIQYSSVEELVKLKQIEELLDREFAQFQKKLANFERVRKFTMLDKPFSIESGEMTPTLKLKRKVIEERYGNLIDEMYNSLRE